MPASQSMAVFLARSRSDFPVLERAIVLLAAARSRVDRLGPFFRYRRRSQAASLSLNPPTLLKPSAVIIWNSPPAAQLGAPQLKSLRSK